MGGHKTLVEALPRSPMGEGISCSLSNREALNRYLEDRDLAIDNNRAERILRGPVVGRNNRLFFGSDRAQETRLLPVPAVSSRTFRLFGVQSSGGSSPPLGNPPCVHRTLAVLYRIDELELLFPDGYHRGAVKMAGLRQR